MRRTVAAIWEDEVKRGSSKACGSGTHLHIQGALHRTRYVVERKEEEAREQEGESEESDGPRTLRKCQREGEGRGRKQRSALLRGHMQKGRGWSRTPTKSTRPNEAVAPTNAPSGAVFAPSCEMMAGCQCQQHRYVAQPYESERQARRSERCAAEEDLEVEENLRI